MGAIIGHITGAVVVGTLAGALLGELSVILEGYEISGSI